MVEKSVDSNEELKIHESMKNQIDILNQKISNIDQINYQNAFHNIKMLSTKYMLFDQQQARVAPTSSDLERMKIKKRIFASLKRKSPQKLVLVTEEGEQVENEYESFGKKDMNLQQINRIFSNPVDNPPEMGQSSNFDFTLTKS